MEKRKKNKKATMKEVAKRAGVTIGTVSHVINGTAPVTIKTKENVLNVIKELNYKPNVMAQGLRRSESKMIGLLVPDITNEYYSRIARSFINSAYSDGYTVMLCGFQHDYSKEKQELDVLVDKGVDAIVVIGGSSGDEKLLKRIADWDIPIVLGDRSTKANDYATVEFDNRSMVKLLVDYLAEKGYSRIGFVTESTTEAMSNLMDRYNGYLDGMYANNLIINEKCVLIKEELKLNKIENGYKLMKDLLKGRARKELSEVFITSSDLVAMGMINAIREAGYQVPKDFGVVGYDDLSISAYFNPRLTTIRQDPNKMSSAIWMSILQLLKKENTYKPHIYLQQNLKKRDSVL